MKMKRYFSYLLGFLGGAALATITTVAISIGIPFGVITIGIPIMLIKKQEERKQGRLESLWPEILDHLISGLHSGLALAETVADLARRGPEDTKSIFAYFENSLREGSEFATALAQVKAQFNGAIADQVCEVLNYSWSAGSRDTALTLRTLSDFIRSDMALRREILAKHGWVKNSAALAAIAPWILLLLLASQPNTVAAYSSGSGPFILILGVALTALAYLWMEKVGHIKQVPRVFR